jgi:hypothetical protein
MFLVFSIKYQLMKPNKSSEKSSITMTHWLKGLSCRSKASWICWKFVWQPHIFRCTICSSNRKMAWLWEALYLPSLTTHSWSTLRNWLLPQQNTNHYCGSSMLTVHLWPGLMAQIVTELPQPPQQFMALHSVHCGNGVRQCQSFSGCSGQQARDDTGHRNL